MSTMYYQLSDGREIPVDPRFTLICTLDANGTPVPFFDAGDSGATEAQQVEQIAQLENVVTNTGKAAIQPTTGGNIAVTTAAEGTSYTAFASQSLKQLTIINDAGVDIRVRQGTSGESFTLWNGSIFTLFGIANANVIQVKRKDDANTQVKVEARWEA